MKLKKINAVLGLLLSAVCLTHVVGEVWNGMTYGALNSQNQILARICGVIAILHILISCYMLFISHEGKRMNLYPRENASTLLQRISGILMIIFLAFHVGVLNALAGHEGRDAGFFILRTAIAILFYGTVFLHISVSFSRALITLGVITSRTTKRRLDRILWVIMGLGFIAASVLITYSYGTFYFNGGRA